ncbi:hypothetical protein [Lentibacter algarum]|uniref:hypothetical protein n=1 Tax=Lentibacter algarum TaxID=576131 RepID=UPI002091503C|nr:hypothetical protein [Lentibacter algarum]
MAYSHPIGDAHPFPLVYALAQAKGYDQLELVTMHDGALMRLFCKKPSVVFRLEGDPGSAIDRQRFDYAKHIKVNAKTPAEILAVIQKAIAAETTAP